MKFKNNYPTLRTLADFFIYSNLWVALTAGSLACLVLLITENQSYNRVALIIALSFLSYNYIYYIGYISHPDLIDQKRKNWLNKHKVLLVALLLLACIIVLIHIFFLSLDQISILAILLPLSLFYIFPFKRNKGLRWLPGLKILLIALSYTLLIVPFQLIHHCSVPTVSLSSLLVFLFLIALGIPFDLRDLDSDTEQLKTIPQVLGTNISILVSQALFMLVGIALFLYIDDIVLRSVNSVFILVFIYSSHISRRQTNYFYSLWLDGLPTLWLIVYFIAK